MPHPWDLYPAIVWLLLLGITAGTGLALLREHRLRRQQHARTRAILSSSFTDLAIVDRNSVLEDCNDAWVRAQNTANPFTVSRIGERWPATAPSPSPNIAAEIDRVRDALDAVLSGRENERTLECEWPVDGGRQSSHLRLQWLARKEGGAVVAHLDVTAIKRGEHEARQAMHDLAHLNMRAGLGELVSGITHELTQSLTASLGNAQALKRMLAAGQVAREDVIAIVDDIAAANREATQIIGRVRQLMRKEHFDTRPLDLNTVVMEVVQVLNSSAVNEGVLLVADLDPDLPAINADRVQLRQVAMNLVLNAVQATGRHPVHPAVVRVATRGGDSHVALTVDDAGPGIAPEALPRLFEPYFTTKEDGFGMGLAISRSIVESHGGSIEVTNVPHAGARFTVTLPLADD